MRMWLRKLFLRHVFGIKLKDLGPNHHRMTVPEKHREIADRAIADTKADAWRNGVEPNVSESGNITTINYGGKVVEVMIVPTEN